MEERITGVMIYYYFVCKRKLWYFCHDLQMENVSQNENVQLGKLLDETSYRRNQKHINIDDTINIDFIKDFQETLYLIFDYPYKYYTFKHFEV